MESGTTDADLLAVADAGGRLTLVPPETRTGCLVSNVWRAEYYTGQYFPTEYRKAASSLLERANANARRRTAPTYAEPAISIAEVKRRNRRAGLHFFDDDRSTYTYVFPGCLIERMSGTHTPPFRPIFQLADGSIVLNHAISFPTAAEAKAHARHLRDANQTPKD